MAVGTLPELGKRKRTSSTSLLSSRSPKHARSTQYFFEYTPTHSMSTHPELQAIVAHSSDPGSLLHKLESIMEVPSPSETRPPLARRSISWSDYGINWMDDGSSPTQTSPIFQYYLPRLSTSDTDLYTTQKSVTHDANQAKTDVKMGEALDEELDLPLIREDEFNYYPGRSGSLDDELRGSKGHLVSERQLTRKKKLAKKRQWEEFSLEKSVLKLLEKLRLKK